jgi:ElaB/YqjD/DUF883 family membrane-anchored ribosome-binding protein
LQFLATCPAFVWVPQIAPQQLQLDIKKLAASAEKWLVVFNLSKVRINFSSQEIEEVITNHLKMLNQNITEVIEHKQNMWVYFYLTMVKVTDRNEYVSDKAWKQVNIMRQYFLFDRKSLKISYTSFIRPILEYADIVCGHVF